MSVEIIVPSMGESVVEATVAQWLRKPGDPVQAGDDLVELETDKVNQTIQAETAGVLATVAFEEGATVTVGAVLGTIEPGAVPAVAPPAAAPSTPSEPVTGPATPATPVASAMAAANQVDLAGVSGTGPAGKIGKEDVSAKIGGNKVETTTWKPTKPAPAPAPVEAAPTGDRRESRTRMSRRRQTIAANLKHAQNTAAMLTTFNEVDMSAVMGLRKRHKDSFTERYGIGLGFMSFFTKAVVAALRQFPTLNAEIQGDEIVLKHFHDIGIAVGVEDGLVVPVVRDADHLSFAGIEKTIKELADKARRNALSLPELTGGTFTITNGGVYGSLLSTPILNHPQVGILGLHAIKERPVVVDGQIVIRPMMNIALSYDHRIIDGSTAVRFLVRVKELIEDPSGLMFES
ncbi:MAG: 2-oxoglutarate dehydrogenase complex dihydrolipoyllysine-residue succinyltransferase [Armatimonadota bacterium]